MGNVFELLLCLPAFELSTKSKDSQRRKKKQFRVRQKSLLLWPGTKVYKLWASKTGQCAKSTKQDILKKIEFTFFLATKGRLTFRWTWELFLITGFQKMAPICILTKVVAIECALAESMANPFVLAFSIISDCH